MIENRVIDLSIFDSNDFTNDQFYTIHTFYEKPEWSKRILSNPNNAVSRKLVSDFILKNSGKITDDFLEAAIASNRFPWDLVFSSEDFFEKKIFNKNIREVRRYKEFVRYVAIDNLPKDIEIQKLIDSYYLSDTVIENLEVFLSNPNIDPVVKNRVQEKLKKLS